MWTECKEITKLIKGEGIMLKLSEFVKKYDTILSILGLVLVGILIFVIANLNG